MMQPPPPSKPTKEPPPHQHPHHHHALPDDETRFTLELEFVQCLANPDYLHWLALNKYLEDPAFVAFLRYLSYWRRPEYARFLVYPQALAVLELLGRPEVRREAGRVQYKDFLQDQQLLQWRFYLNNRRRLAGANAAAATGSEAVPAAASAMEGMEAEAGGVGKAGGTWSNALNEPPLPPSSEGVESAAWGGGGAGAGAGAAAKPTAAQQARK